MPTLILFLTENGLSVQQMFILHACGSITVCLTEIPTGVLGDLMGKKKSIMLGFVFISLGFFLYSISSHFFSFIGAIMSIGLGQSFISGSDTALLYDTLKLENKTHLFSKIEGRNVALGNLSESIAFILGGYLAMYNLRFPFMAQTVIASIGFVIATLLTDIHNKRRITFHSAQKQFEHTVVYILKKNKLLKWLILFSTTAGVATLIMAWFVQVYFKAIDLPINYFGIVGACLNLTVSIGAIITHRLEKKWSLTRLFFISICGLSIGYLIPAFSLQTVMLVFFFMLYFSRGIITTAIRTSISKASPSKLRASIMSVRSLNVRLFHAICAPFIGYLNDTFSFQTALLFSGSTIAITGFFSLFNIRKILRVKTK